MSSTVTDRRAYPHRICPLGSRTTSFKFAQPSRRSNLAQTPSAKNFSLRSSDRGFPPHIRDWLPSRGRAFALPPRSRGQDDAFIFRPFKVSAAQIGHWRFGCLFCRECSELAVRLMPPMNGERLLFKSLLIFTVAPGQEPRRALQETQDTHEYTVREEERGLRITREPAKI